MEFVRVIRFAEFKKKLGTSHVPASLIGRAIEKFDFKTEITARTPVRILYLELFRGKQTDLFAFGNYLF